MASFEWTTAFTTPATLADLTITPDPASSSFVVAWTPSADPYHESYPVDVQGPDGDWIEVARPVAAEAVWVEAPLNVAQRVRVRDWTGTADLTGYSIPVEDADTLESDIDQMVHPDGDPDFIRDLTHVAVGTIRERGIDQVILQPLSGTDGDTAHALVYTGQFEASALTLTLDVLEEERELLRWLDRATRLGVRYMLVKTIKGAVYRAQLGGRREQETVYGWRVEMTAVVVA